MNVHAIYHKPESEYCFAAAADKVTLRLRVAQNENIDSIKVLYNTKYDIAQKQFEQLMEFTCSDGFYDWYSARLTLNDRRLSYVFAIESNGVVKYFCEDGLLDGYDFNFAYFNSFQFAYVHDSDVVRNVEWLNNAVFYQIFVDRFYKASQKDETYITADWNELPTPKSFFGGDLDGITQKLPYIRDLGVNALYLTPIFKSKSNHKYDISDYYAVDETFGGNDALKRLCDACHSMGIRIVLDAVFNHASEDFAPFSDVKAKGKKSRYYDWFVIDGEKISSKKDNYACFAKCSYMPKLDTDNAEVQNYFCEVASHYMRTYGIDGWRLDVSDEVSHEFWRKFRSAVKKINPDCVLIGENWHDSTSYTGGDQFDSIMNYAVTKQMMDFWTGDLDAQGLAYRLNRQFMRYNDVTNGMMFNLLDCHDTDRFYTLLNCDKDKLMCAIATLVFISGSYSLYYGTEILMQGGSDPDNRRTFDWNKLHDKKILENIDMLKRILALKRQPAIKYGKTCLREENGLFVVERSCKEQTLILKICKNAVSVKANGSIKYNVTDVFCNNSFTVEGRLL